MRKINVVILITETAGTVGVLSSSLSLSARFSIQDKAMDVARAATGGRYLLAGYTEGSKGLMVLRVKPTPTRFPTNILYTPMSNTP